MDKVKEVLSTLTPEQRALLELKLKQKRSQTERRDSAIGKRPDPHYYPLSSGQQRLWAFARLTAESSLYTIADAVHLRGELDYTVLEFCINELLQRHETLRARFDDLNGEPLQFVDDYAPIQLSVIDVAGDDEEVCQNNLRTHLRAESMRPFDLTQGPLLRTILYRLASQEHVLFVAMHHIVSDGWSFGLFMRELSTIYGAHVAQSQASLPTLPIQYADYAYWQQQWLKSEQATRQLAYWQEKLAGAEPLRLPGDLASPPQRTQRGASRSYALSTALTEKLKSFSRQENTTLFVTLLTAFKVLLNRTTSQTDIVIASPAVGRIYPELEEIIGYFNNIVVLRTLLAEELSLEALLGYVHQTTVSAYDNQIIPFQNVADLATLRHVPLARALFTLQDAVENVMDLPGIQAASLAVEQDVADFELFLFVEQKPQNLVLDLRYRTDLFSADQIEQMLVSLEMVLETISTNPEQILGAMPRVAWPAASQSVDISKPADVADGLEPEKLSENASDELLPGKLELQLVNIWKKVLNRSAIALTDNFFELGGHSLLALQLFAAIEKEITNGSKLPLALLLKAPTVAQLADALRHEGWSDAWSPLVVIKNGAPEKQPLFLVHAAGGNVLVYQDLARRLEIDQPVYGLQSQGLDGVHPLQSSVEEMAALYVREIQSVQPQGPYLLGGYCMGGTIALEMAQQLKAQGQEVALLALFETYNWANIGSESLFDQIYFWVQKIEFHWRNFLLLNRTQKRTFFQEKLEALRSRSHIWRGVLSAKFGGMNSIDNQQNMALAELWNNNDAVSVAYCTSDFDGEIVLIKAMKEYSIYKRPGLDLSLLARSGAKVHTLPVYPAGMLVEPFVDHLAAALQASLNHAQGAETLR